MEDIGRQLKKGVLDVLLLKLLEEEPMYGYALMAALDARSGGFFSIKEGTLYPVLYRLEDGGYIQSSWAQEPARRGAPRKYYTITGLGRIQLEQGEAALQAFAKAIKAVMEGQDDV